MTRTDWAWNCGFSSSVFHYCFVTACGSPNKRKWTFGQLSKSTHSPPHWRQCVLVKGRNPVVTFPLFLCLWPLLPVIFFFHFFNNCVTLKSYLASATLSFLIWKMGVTLCIWHSIWECVYRHFPFPLLEVAYSTSCYASYFWAWQYILELLELSYSLIVAAFYSIAWVHHTLYNQPPLIDSHFQSFSITKSFPVHMSFHIISHM